MKLGDLFTKIWYCTVLDPEFKCNPEYPCLDVAPVCGFRWTVSFIPEDFEPIRDMELIRPGVMEELGRRYDEMGQQILGIVAKVQSFEEFLRLTNGGEVDVDELLSKFFPETTT